VTTACSPSASCATPSWSRSSRSNGTLAANAHLVVVSADPNLTDREFDELRADALHKWMYPTNTPEAWV
jgi:hypothetical protein